MAAAKAAGRNPRELAAEVAGRVDLEPMADAPEVAGPGFLNVRLREDWIAAVARRSAGRRPPRRRADRRPRDDRHRLLVAERRQADARRPHPLDGHRREPRPDPRGPRPQGHPRQPPGRLGPPVRPDPLGLEAPPRPGRPTSATPSASSPGSTAWPATTMKAAEDLGQKLDKVRALEARGQGRRGRRPVRQALRRLGPAPRAGRADDRRGPVRHRGRPRGDGEAPRRRPREPPALGAVHAPLPGGPAGDLRPPRRPVRRPARRELLRPDAPRRRRGPEGEGPGRAERGGHRRLHRGDEGADDRPEA